MMRIPALVAATGAALALSACGSHSTGSAPTTIAAPVHPAAAQSTPTFSPTQRLKFGQTANIYMGDSSFTLTVSSPDGTIVDISMPAQGTSHNFGAFEALNTAGARADEAMSVRSGFASTDTQVLPGEARTGRLGFCILTSEGVCNVDTSTGPIKSVFYWASGVTSVAPDAEWDAQ